MLTTRTFQLTIIPALTLLAFAFFSKSSGETGSITPSDMGVVRVFDRESWKYLDNSVKFSVYRTFPHEKKKEFWRLKHEELERLDWNSAEQEHISSLYTIISEHPELMERGTALQEQEDEFEIFLYNWKEHARDELGWTPKVIYAVSGTGNEVLDKSGELRSSSGVAWGMASNFSTKSFNGDCRLCEKYKNSFFIHYIPYPGNCRAYFMCDRGMAYPMLCFEGLRFDYDLQICDYPENVFCWDDPFY